MATVLILSGLSPSASSFVPINDLLQQLVDKAKFVRIVDKYLILPQLEPPHGTFTCWLPLPTRQLLASEILSSKKFEYLQANLSLSEARSRVFTLPPDHGSTFDWVFDFTGFEIDQLTLGLPKDILQQKTVGLSKSLGEEAAERKVGAYIRPIPYFYSGPSEKEPLKESDGGKTKVWKESVKGVIWNDTVRELGKLSEGKGLKLGVVRPGVVWGGGVSGGFTPRLLMGEIYRYLGEKMEFLWDEDLKAHTLHSYDYASALLFVASHISALSTIPPTLLDPLPISSDDKQEIKAAVFNAVDEEDTDQAKMAEMVKKVVGVEVGWKGGLVNTFAKMNLEEVVDDVNDKHATPWPELLLSSTPAILNTPLSPDLSAELLSFHPVNLDGKKLRDTTGWKPKFGRFEEAEVRKNLEEWRKEGVWPNADPKGKK